MALLRSTIYIPVKSGYFLLVHGTCSKINSSILLGRQMMQDCKFKSGRIVWSNSEYHNDSDGDN